MFKENSYKFGNRSVIYKTKALSVNEYGNTIDSVLAFDEKYIFEFDAKNEFIRKHCHISDITELVLANGSTSAAHGTSNA